MVQIVATGRDPRTTMCVDTNMNFGGYCQPLIEFAPREKILDRLPFSVQKEQLMDRALEFRLFCTVAGRRGTRATLNMVLGRVVYVVL